MIIKKLDEKRDEEKDGEYTEKHAFEELLALSQKASHSDIISRFLHDYYDGPPSEVEKRVTIPYRLVSEGGMKKEDFLKEFGLSLSKVWSNVSDFPNLLSSMSKVFFEFIKKDLVKYNEIEIDWTGGMEKATDDISEEIQFVLKDFVEVSCKLLKEKVTLGLLIHFIIFILSRNFLKKKRKKLLHFYPKLNYQI